MRKLLELLGTGLLLIGGSSLVHYFTGWFGKWAVLDRLPFLDGYELYAGGVVAVLGFAVLCAGDLVPDDDARASARTPARTSRPPAGGAEPGADGGEEGAVDRDAGASGADARDGADPGGVSAGADPDLPA
ncbi:hypothetical protein OYE22_06155 [Streptomyces sp. 71268]|uniref:hypothetical protein n=1 Tax=Streptomyces sp. 71268 TaxID=3002640 RepID=UPI0023F82291|nr:hypothetical protein [Streptomyces sp. 71268]WEV24827.1 hypothetical protein OYE22_06155 [Streptomyces sp. 71268]